MKALALSSILILFIGSVFLSEAMGQKAQKLGDASRKLSPGITMASTRASGASIAFTQAMKNVKVKIPDYILSHAESITILSANPTFGKIGKDKSGAGIVVARDPNTGHWSAPVFLTVKGGKVDGPLVDTAIEKFFTDGADFILVGMDKRATESFLTEEIYLGRNFLVLPGPFGKVTNYTNLTVGFICYVNFNGVVTGVSIYDCEIKQDNDLNDAVYEEKKLNAYLFSKDVAPTEVFAFTNTVSRYDKNPHPAKNYHVYTE